MGEDKIGQGKENSVAFIEQHPEIASQIEEKIRAEVFPGQVLKTKDGTPVDSAAKAKKTAKKADAADEAAPSAQEGLF